MTEAQHERLADEISTNEYVLQKRLKADGRMHTATTAHEAITALYAYIMAYYERMALQGSQ